MDNTPGWPDITRTTQNRRRSLGIGMAKTALLILVMGGILAGGGFFFFGGQSEIGDHTPENAPAPSVKNQYVLQNPGAASPEKPPPLNRVYYGSKGMPPPVIKNPLPQKTMSNEKRIVTKSPVIPGQDDLSKKEQKGLSVATEPPLPKTRQPAPLDQFEDPRVDLQAIAWDPGTHNSFVVINSQIVRVGGSVDGIEVIKIGKNSVSFQEGAKKWQQIFKIR